MPTRRAQLAALGLVAAVPFAAVPFAAVPFAAAAPAAAAGTVQLTATRRQLNLPAVPALGVTYIATFDVKDGTGAAAGTAWAGSSIVDVTPDGPVVLSMVVLRLADGEVHYQRVIDRYGPYPRTATGAVLGGTGAYQSATGTVDVTWPDANTVALALHLS
jgi:hypothetical protein